MKLKIVKDNNPIMRKRSELVSLPLSSENKELLDEMLLYLKRSQDEEYAKKHNIRPGVGMAAIQVGHLKRMFVIYYQKSETEYVMYQLVNPKIISSSVKKAYLKSGEGCLSVPKDMPGYVYRYFRITIKGYDVLTDQEVTLKLSGYPAIVFQHEYDHLDGVLYTDKIDKKNPFFEDPEAVGI